MLENGPDETSLAMESLRPSMESSDEETARSAKGTSEACSNSTRLVPHSRSSFFRVRTRVDSIFLELESSQPLVLNRCDGAIIKDGSNRKKDECRR